VLCGEVARRDLGCGCDLSLILRVNHEEDKLPHLRDDLPGPRGVGQSVTECVVKPLCVVKVTGSKPAGKKNPTMLRVGVAQARCDPRVILTA
jgi:hypothetical protein